MNDAPRLKLRQIIERHGRGVIENPRRLENLLRDYCGDFQREIFVLTTALEENAVADMIVSSNSPRQLLLARLTRRLSDNLALSEAASRWSIESWAWALGIISDAELTVENAADKSHQSEVKNIQNDFSPQTVFPNVQTADSPLSNQTATRQPQKSSIQTAAAVTPVSMTFVVSPHGGGNFTTINEALRSVPANSRLLIREGLYHESVRLDKNVEIAGDGAIENIVITGQTQSCIFMQTESAVVRGLTLNGRGKLYDKAFFTVDIAFGKLTLQNCDISSDTLACVAIHGAQTEPFLKNCSMHDSTDSGIYIFDNARARIENCELYRNANDNLAITQGANPTVKNCRIFGGENGGVVIWGNGATASIENCEISNHRLANVGVSQSANPIFRRCAIFGGRDTGIFVRQNGYGTFEECNVYSNLKAEVAVVNASKSTFRRCSIYNGNESGVFVGGQASAFIESCNIHDNSEAGVFVSGGSSVAISRCNIHRNGKVAVRLKERSRARVEDSDLRGNRIAAWETEHGVFVERKNNYD